MPQHVGEVRIAAYHGAAGELQVRDHRSQIFQPAARPASQARVHPGQLIDPVQQRGQACDGQRHDR
jgi:hypothetical protein